MQARLPAVRRLRPGPRGRPPRTGPCRRFRATVAYDGRNYAGLQRQKHVVTVQEMLEAGLARVLGHPVSVQAAGRTDAGVHAEGQVVAWDSTADLPPHAFAARLGQVLPPDVRVVDVALASPDFRPRLGVASKLYRYDVLLAPGPCPARERTAWRLSGPLDTGAMQDGARRLVGTHDFRAFRTDPGADRRDAGTVRTVSAIRVLALADLIRIEVSGPGFLYMMVRNMVAALVRVGAGDEPVAWIEDALASRDRKALPPPAPAAGLTLVSVRYLADG